MNALDDLARYLTSGAAPYAFCGIGLSRVGKATFHTATADGITADADSVFRVASVSKIVTAAALKAAASRAGLTRSYDADAGAVLGVDLRHPGFPDQPVTLGMLMTHTAGLTDSGGYTFDGKIADQWTPATAFGPHAPGTYFAYSNLGYILLAAAAEVLSGQRFDRLVQSGVLGPNGLIAGFNWAGLDGDALARCLPTYRRDDRRATCAICAG